MANYRGLGAERTIGDYDNSLSRAILCAQRAITTAALYAAVSAAGTYAAVVVMETRQFILRRRGARWMAPGFVAIVAATIGSKVGIHHALAEIDTRADYMRRQRAYQQQLRAAAASAAAAAGSATPGPAE